MRGVRPGTLSAAIVGVVLACAVVATPTTSVAAPDADAQAREARTLFDQAEAEFSRGRFEEALVGYQRAYQVRPFPAFVFNMAQCARNLGRYEDARALYRQYLVLDPQTRDRPVVEELIADMNRRIDQQTTSRLVLTAGPRGTAATGPATKTSVLALAPGGSNANAAATASLLGTATPADASIKKTPVYRRGWFWVAIGVAAAGTAAVVIAANANHPDSTLMPIDCRNRGMCQ